MFKIDFLKGQGLPSKGKQAEARLFAGIGAVFILILVAMIAQFFYGSIVLITKQRYKSSLDTRLQKMSGEGSLKARIKKNLGIYDECYFEIADSLGRYVQWTPLLREIAVSLPSSMLLNELSVTRRVSREKVASAIESGKEVDYEIISRTLDSDLYGFNSDAGGKEIKNYLAACRDSAAFNGAFEKVYLAASGDKEYQDSAGKVHNVRNYSVKAQLKSQKTAGENQ